MKSPSPTARPAKNKKIDVNFSGGKLTSDAGVLLLQKVDQKLRLTERVNLLICDPRDPLLVAHQQEHLLAQRLDSIALGYEDVNDQTSLRKDPALLAAIKNDTNEELAEAQCNTIRMKLFKVATLVTESVRRIVFSLSNVYPMRDLWLCVYNRLLPGYTAPSG